CTYVLLLCFFFQAEDGIRDLIVTGVQTCALPICLEIQLAESVFVKVVSDATWRCAKEAVDGWDKTGFDDAPWTEAAIIGRYGDRSEERRVGKECRWRRGREREKRERKCGERRGIT